MPNKTPKLNDPQSYDFGKKVSTNSYPGLKN